MKRVVDDDSFQSTAPDLEYFFKYKAKMCGSREAYITSVWEPEVGLVGRQDGGTFPTEASSSAFSFTSV